MKATEPNCEVVKAKLPSYVFEELAGSDESRVRDHLGYCMACREQEENLRTVVRAVRRRDRARRRLARQRHRLRAVAALAIGASVLAAILLWSDRQRQLSSERFAQLSLEMQMLSKQVASLEAPAGASGVTVEPQVQDPQAGAKETVAIPTPPAPPSMPVDGTTPGPSSAAIGADGGGIQLLDIGVALGQEHPPVEAQLPYDYQELRSLVLAGVQPDARRVDPGILIDHFGPRYRSDVETPLVLKMAAAPSPFDRESLVVSVGVGHQPVATATESNTDYTFILAENGSGALQRTLRKALLPWLFDKLDGSCRVTVVAAGAATETLLQNEPVRLTPEGQPAFGKLPTVATPPLYDLLREHRQQLEKRRGDRRQHVMVLISDDASLPGADQAPWPEQLDDFKAPWLDFTVVQIGDGATVSQPRAPYLAEMARQGDGRLISIGTDVLGWEEKLLPRVASLSATALHAVGAEIHFNPSLVAAFRPLHAQAGWAKTSIGAADRWPTVARLADGASRTGVYLVTPQQGGEPDRVVECRVRFDAGDAKFAAEERIGLQPEQISNDFFTAPQHLQVPVVAAEISDILLAPESRERQARIAALREVWSRLTPSLAATGADHQELGELIAALW